MEVPFFRPSITDAEIDEVTATLRSGWLTTGPQVKRFEEAFAAAVGARYAVGVNSCTAALHLAVEALGLKAGSAVLVPTMTFAATAEIVRYLGAFPVLVDCDYETLNIDLRDAVRKIEAVRRGDFASRIPADTEIVGIIPVHVGGWMISSADVQAFARETRLWVVEDAAHAFPAAWRTSPQDPWQRCGQGTAAVTCFSFYANKTITTGEGGMAVTEDPSLADRIRVMSLHGLSRDAWTRYSSSGSWDYRIVEAGYKYNLTDISAAIGIHQLIRAEEMRLQREAIARRYLEAFASLEEAELPLLDDSRLHSWHLFPIRLRLEQLTIGRDEFIEQLKENGVGCSVHWRPLHLHPYYAETVAARPEDFPVATNVWQRLVSLPIFQGMRDDELRHVVDVVMSVCARFHRGQRIRGSTAEFSHR
jgi:perosamine synthetase